MAAYFEATEPFELERHFSKDLQSRLVTADSRSPFLNNCSCAGGRGVYIFAIGRKGRGAPLPWYVGKTERKTFGFEAFTGDKLLKYARASTMASGTPYMYILEFVGHGRAARRFIDDLETLCVLFARNINPLLLNEKKSRTKVARILDMGHLQITGVLNRTRGKPSKAANEFMRLLDLVR